MVFDDVKGCDEAKKELQEIVEFLMNPEKFSKLGGKLPKGVLLSGNKIGNKSDIDFKSVELLVSAIFYSFDI